MLQDSVDFDPGVGIHFLKSKGKEDLFLVGLDEQGTFIQAKSFGSLEADYVYSIEIDDFGNLLMTGFFAKKVDFDPKTDSTILKSNGNTDIFLSKFSLNGCDLPNFHKI